MNSAVQNSPSPVLKREEYVESSAHRKVYLVGGGIASLAAAAFLIRDGDIPGCNITILEELEKLGGSLDGTGTPHDGYTLRGGRMLESKYLCTYDLFSSIPTLDQSKTVTQEIFEWNETMKTSSKSRLVRDGRRIDAPRYGLGEKQILTLERLAAEPEGGLGNSSIADQFDPSFFETNFWLMWCTTFAFQPWHSAVEFKRYLVRFTHMVEGFNRLHGIMRTVYNQYDSMVRPLQRWLEERGVRFELNTRVTDLLFEESDAKRVRSIHYESGGVSGKIDVASEDLVIVTLGSMTEASCLGSMESVPALHGKADGGAWTLWEKIAAGRPEFGRPSTFTDHIDQSKWVSFTTTLRDPAFFRIVRDFTGNVPGEGGLITFAESSWLASIVLPHQPHFIGQPEGVNVFWGYGLSVDEPGDFVKKSMAACTGREIMTEVLGHLRVETEAIHILETSTCIPCMMPFITSQFLRRVKGDRPQVQPEGWKNLAFTGQFCELPDDVVFTVEYSIRSAQTAVYALLDLKRKPPPVYKGHHDPRVLYKAYRTLHDMTG
ncbi:oleate hydratase [Silvibacterium bohemicum]|uniref:Oleate hydratase n=1 Tax=Silvibacterium bohemicum TaxID=1577686 RepID=A0A841JQZ4_9BACT|nr:oleate hydratase [Silvibacterium bohemicum]MBB6143813.1 oleate hydratase [Silvibacterium bohemicum]